MSARQALILAAVLAAGWYVYHRRVSASSGAGDRTSASTVDRAARYTRDLFGGDRYSDVSSGGILEDPNGDDLGSVD